MIRFVPTFKGAAFALLAVIGATAQAAAVTSDLGGISTILREIGELEGRSDPKCYATAARLEDFMYGTPLNHPARSTKNEAQKALARRVWTSASERARDARRPNVSAADVSAALAPYFSYFRAPDSHWDLVFPDATTLRINATDKRQYSSVAYALRAILAVQQEDLLTGTNARLPLGRDAVARLKDAIDLYTLAVLKVADELARRDSRHELDETLIASTWHSLLPAAGVAGSELPLSDSSHPEALAASDLALANAVIDQKVASYQVYNEISNPLFVRNLQVYFARLRWPDTEEEASAFRGLFTESLIALARRLYSESENEALAGDDIVIREQHVVAALEQFLPHRINEYEDVIFFPGLDRGERVTIEAYDLDAFRDSGLHWRYLQFALQSDGFRAQIEPDPFALELITENIAHVGVLLLRLAGDIGREAGAERLSVSQLDTALQVFRTRSNAASRLPDAYREEAPLPSAGGDAATVADSGGMTRFVEVTAAVGIDYMHRTSDWLSRQLRSYLQRDEETGVITIPPAFGGAGVAVADVDNDGHTDILLLGGRGAALYRNDGDGGFEDVTRAAGLDWVRDDNTAGEMRQPIIADLDNDGWQDIVITYVDDHHRVYRNNGDLTFSDVTGHAGLGGPGLVGGPATVFDYDNDGLLDIYVTYFGNYLEGVLPTLARRNSNGLPNRLFRNRGNLRFEDVTAGSGLDNTGWAQAVTHTDLDGDGWQDVIVGNDFGVNSYYRNRRDGTFQDIAADLGTDKPSYTMGIGIADLNRDLAPDIYISNIVTMNKDQRYVLPSADTTMAFNPDKLASMRVVEANDLFLSAAAEGGRQYRLSRAVERGYSSTGWAWGADFFDSDNDGDDDLYVLNGMNEFNVYSRENPYYTDPLENARRDVEFPESSAEANVFFLNNDGRLNNVSRGSGLDFVGNSRSAAYLDIEGDGDLDIVVNNYHEAARVFRNDSAPAGNAWLKVRLVGDPARGVNRDAIGARLLLYRGSELAGWREVHGSSGYMTVQSKEKHFGLGAGEGDLRLTVVWPNGERQTFTGLAERQRLTLHYRPDAPMVDVAGAR